MRKILFTASLMAALLGAPAAHAHLEGDLIFRVGAVLVDPRERSDDIHHQALGDIPGTKVTLDHEVQMGMNYLYMLTDNIGVELLAATPFTQELRVKGMPGPYAGLNGRLGEVEHLPPTLSLVYFPLDDTYDFQPYVGVGFNYTFFFNDKLSREAKGKGFQSGLDIDNSYGLSAQIGVDYMISDQYLINAQMRYIDIDTKGTTWLAGGRVDVDVDVDPFVYMLSFGYRF
ncbi:outer membrane protein [Azomonas agilis]|uniref:Outer membrane protein n=1 Tax=Azomonas agilis TaxID=116849 RepID=A0A562J2C8_9GAMM|nr:OmpW family outer membrane protein [Azomonas agilis]TWH77273.1 outer membrane protein [Azomonas agilis]